MLKIHLFDEAHQAAMNRVVPQQIELIRIEAGMHRYLAEEITAQQNVPPFHRAMMDGYAIQSADTAKGSAELSVIATMMAGTKPLESIHSGQAIRIMTGAPVPDGADAVARFEWCDTLPDGHIGVLKAIRPGESVQPAGEDGHVGQSLISSGTKLTGFELAVCKTFGVSSLHVTVKPRIYILITGNELVHDLSIPLKPGQIYGANDLFLQGALLEDGADVTEIAYVRDDLAEIEHLLRAAALDHDYIIVTGGVSAGDLDFVPSAIRTLAGSLDIEKVLMRPGSPFVVSQIGECTTFALSGNPAASFIQFETLVRPAIRATLGAIDRGFPYLAKLSHPIQLKQIKHTRFLRGVAQLIDGGVVVDTSMAQSPGVMSGFAHANCLVRLDDSAYLEGAMLPIRLFKPLK